MPETLTLKDGTFTTLFSERDFEELVDKYMGPYAARNYRALKSSNKKLGNDFEAELCGILFEHGFWVHNLAQNASGQPADIIAVRNGRAYLIDCKVCSGGKFDLRRVEENQESAMRLWENCGNGSGWFALKIGDEIRMICHKDILHLRDDVSMSVLSDTAIRNWAINLGWWINAV